MMGRGHALSGAAVWTALGPTISAGLGRPMTLTEYLVGGAIISGAALLPDIDEPQSTIARSFGPATVLLAHGVNALSAGWHNLTKTGREPFIKDGHRMLTHTLLGMAVLSILAGVGCGVWGSGFVVGLAAFLFGLTVRGLMGDWAKKQGFIAVTVLSVAAGWLIVENLPGGNYWWLSAVMLVGMILHGLGDGITKEGMPWVAPLQVRGKAWWEFTLPSFLRIRAGGTVETLILYPVFTLVAAAGVVAYAMGGWPVLLSHFR